MGDDQQYEDAVRTYRAAQAAFVARFREWLAKRGEAVTSPDHEQALRVQFNVETRDELTRVEALGVEVHAQQAALERRLVESLQRGHKEDE